ncbi:hypothetical protein SM124_01500 [Bacillus sp. 31A1R]|uniref:Uncharacterized protein n=2 Tax=Robertmurraya mangrovi TaxID=3098077 RepID=A0ABU5ITC9_9BACI|nr:hypothetical protein [Bacillus sp. 31A1R]
MMKNKAICGNCKKSLFPSIKTRSGLLENIDFTSSCLIEYINKEKEIKSLTTPGNAPFFTLLNVTSYIAIVYFFFNFHGKKYEIVTYFIITIFFNFVVLFIIDKTYKHLREKKLLKIHAKDIKRKREELNIVANSLHLWSKIPQTYWNLNILNKFYSDINNHRADTLKECVNLLEAEKQLNDRIIEIKKVNQKLDNINKELKHIRYNQYFD